MIVKVVYATGDLSTGEKEHENTSREALYDTFIASEEAAIVRFERSFYSIVLVLGFSWSRVFCSRFLVLGFWRNIDGAVSTRLDKGNYYRRKRWEQKSVAFIGL